MTDARKPPQPIDALRRAHWLLYAEGENEYARQIEYLIRSYGFEVKGPPRVR